jgi:hypothetical protein
LDNFTGEGIEHLATKFVAAIWALGTISQTGETICEESWS